MTILARSIPAIHCQDGNDGSTKCIWTDDTGHEHALYYMKDKEYLFFNHNNRCWIALLNGKITPFTESISYSGIKLARALTADSISGLDITGWIPYELYEIHVEPKKKKGAWIDNNNKIHTIEWDPTSEFEHYDKNNKVWYPLPRNP